MITVLVLVAIVVAVLALIWAGQRQLIYFPDTSPPSPAETGLANVEPVSFTTSDGLRLSAWFLAAPGGPPRTTVIVFNGNAGHRGYRALLGEALRRHGMHVLLMDYRGYGGNPGTPTEEGFAADARASREYLLSRPDVDRGRLVYLGESLGAAVAIRLAVEHPPLALILRSPFSSLADVGAYHYPILPVRLLLRDRFASIDRAPGIRSPVLVIAGTRDGIIPLAHSRRLYDAIAVPKRFVEIPGADHNDLELLAGEKMIRAIAEFSDGVRS